MSSLVLRNVQLRVHNLPEVSDIVKRWQLNRTYHEPARFSLLSGKVHTLAVPDPGFPRGRQPQWWAALTYYYRPQRSCGKVMFLHLSVSHSVHRVCVGQTPSPLPADISQHALGQTPHWADISQHVLGQTYPNMHCGRHPPPPTATTADGAHTNGMHSCFGIIFYFSKTA